MRVFFSEKQLSHHGESFLVAGQPKPIPEVPERAGHLKAAVSKLGLDICEPDDHGLSPLAAIHKPEYLNFLQTACERWVAAGGNGTVVPNVHPRNRNITYPHSAVGQAGYHLGDTACPVTESTWDAVYWSAHTAVSAATDITNGAKEAYALCRPPGHHAGPDLAGGFCYLNNSAIAAQHLRSQCARVAILDIDLHHGNGTQDIFYHRDDVMTLSIHADPRHFYPFFWGHEAERGEAAGLGYNKNYPLPLGSGDNAFIAALETAMESVKSFAADALVIATGLDASEQDPFGGLAVTSDGFERIGAIIGAYPKPVLLVQEGGYISDVLSTNLYRLLHGFLGARGAIQ